MHIHRTAYHALKRAVKLRLVPRNVAEHVGDELPRIHGREMLCLNEAEVVQLETAARGTELEAAVMLAIDAGCRRGELLALRWSDLDSDSSRIVIRRSLEKTKAYGLRFKETKTGRSRTNTLTEDTIACIRRHKGRQNERRLVLGSTWRDNDLIFPSGDGSPWDPHAFGEVFKRLRATLPNFPNIRLHDLRHTSATLLLRQGVATKVVSERLGHSTTTLTTDTYQHVLAGMDKEASDKLGKALRIARMHAAQ